MDSLNSGERQVAPDLSGIRRDHVARYEFAAGLLEPNKKIIDFGCGVGYGTAVLADTGSHSVLGIDRSLEAIVYAAEHYQRDNCEFIAGTEAALGTPAGDAYDVAIAFEIIEHLQHPLAALRQLCRIAPKLICSVPNEDVFPWRNFAFHHRHYTKEQLQALLEAAGYEVKGWYGQRGTDGDVEAFLEGRTLVAVAERAPAESGEKRGALVHIKNVPEHVTIVGMGPSSREFLETCKLYGGRKGYCDEVWGLNMIGDIFGCDRIFHMDDMLVQEGRAANAPNSNIARMVEWMRHHPGPVYTSIVREGYPGMVEFPLQDVLRNFQKEIGGEPYFNSTGAWAIAYAVHIGVKRLSLFGLDYTLQNVQIAEAGRGCCEFWLGVGAARGMEITVPEASTMLDACQEQKMRLYGYDLAEVHIFDGLDEGPVVKLTPERNPPSAEEIEKRYDHARHPNPLMNGDKS